jgi:hypothetical protein
MERRPLRRRWSAVFRTSAALGFVWLGGARGAGSDPWERLEESSS